MTREELEKALEEPDAPAPLLPALMNPKLKLSIVTKKSQQNSKVYDLGEITKWWNQRKS